MSELVINNEEQLKAIFKSALLELIEEKRDFFHELIEDVIEEMALVRAIKEGKQSETIQNITY